MNKKKKVTITVLSFTSLLIGLSTRTNIAESRRNKNNYEFQYIEVEERVFATSIEVKTNENTENLMPHDEFQLYVNYYPASTDAKYVKWYSSNDNIASIDKNGNVFCKAMGEVTIRAEYYWNTNISDSLTFSINGPSEFVKKIKNFNSIYSSENIYPAKAIEIEKNENSWSLIDGQLNSDFWWDDMDDFYYTDSGIYNNYFFFNIKQPALFNAFFEYREDDSIKIQLLTENLLNVNGNTDINIGNDYIYKYLNPGCYYLRVFFDRNKTGYDDYYRICFNLNERSASENINLIDIKDTYRGLVLKNYVTPFGLENDSSFVEAENFEFGSTLINTPWGDGPVRSEWLPLRSCNISDYIYERYYIWDGELAGEICNIFHKLLDDIEETYNQYIEYNQIYDNHKEEYETEIMIDSIKFIISVVFGVNSISTTTTLSALDIASSANDVMGIGSDLCGLVNAISNLINAENISVNEFIESVKKGITNMRSTLMDLFNPVSYYDNDLLCYYFDIKTKIQHQKEKIFNFIGVTDWVYGYYCYLDFNSLTRVEDSSISNIVDDYLYDYNYL